MPKSRGLAKNLARAQTHVRHWPISTKSEVIRSRSGPGAPCEGLPANRWVLHLPANDWPPIFVLIFVPFMRTNQYQ